MRVLGYWAFYVVVGVVVVAMAIGGGGDLGSEDARSPIKTRTKVIGAFNGMALAALALGLYLRTDSAVRSGVATMIVGVAAPAALALTVWSLMAIARDLRRGAPGARRSTP
jgi:hypothetical protein